MSTKKYSIGDPVEITTKRSDRTLTIKGKIRELKNNYGHVEYVISDGRVDDFSVRVIN